LEVELPITPMLDLAFQVLLFFILTYRPPQLEGQMDLVLPESGQARATPSDGEADIPAPAEPPAEITVMIRAQRQEKDRGAISRILIQERKSLHAKEVINESDLRNYLLILRPNLGNKTNITIQAESGLRYAYLMTVMDACTSTGFINVTFGSPLDRTTDRP
jgi:biopolymer transport protein ExbD